MFQVIPDGRLVAYTADKGEKVLEVQTGLRGGMGPPITYMLDGKQYVALAGGSGALPAFGPPPEAQVALAAAGGWLRRRCSTRLQAAQLPHQPLRCGSTPGWIPGFGGPQVTPKLLVFVLDGKAPLPGPPGAVGSQ